MTGDAARGAWSRWRGSGAVAATYLRHTLAGAAIGVLLTAPLSADIIDRVLAVVGEHVIMLSDVRAYSELGLIRPDTGDDPQPEVLTQLIDRTLILGEVNRFVVSEPAPVSIDRRYGELRAALATDDAAFEDALRSVGLTEISLRQIIRDDLRIDSYLRQRFASAARPTDAEAARYYREHEDVYSRDGVTLPFDEVSEIARADLLEERRLQLIDDWLGRVRRRVVVRRLGVTTGAQPR